MNSRPSEAHLLHLAALPFPSHQGTQAAIASMLEASAAAGRHAELLTYGTEGADRPRSFVLHRAAGRARAASLRSGPSAEKLWLDARMFASLRALRARLRPDVMIAHHVEAALQATALRKPPVIFFAHTDLQEELPTYGPERATPLLSWAGGALDHYLVGRCAAVAAISPALRDRLVRTASADKPIAYVPTPWQVPDEATADERARSRQRLGLAQSDEVVLYAGNLDAYQGLDTLLLAVAEVQRSRPRTRLLVATESDAKHLLVSAGRFGLAGRLTVTSLVGESARRTAHAAADIAAVPRHAPGGLPIKLLDGLARGIATAALPRASAGLPLSNVARLADDDSPSALARVMGELLSSPTLRGQMQTRGPAYVRQAHAPARYFDALDHLVAELLAPARSRNWLS